MGWHKSSGVTSPTLWACHCIMASFTCQLMGIYDKHMCYETLDTHLAQSCCRGWRGGGCLKQDTVGFLFCLLLFHWCFPIYLSDQVIEDLRRQNKERRKLNRRFNLNGFFHTTWILTVSLRRVQQWVAEHTSTCFYSKPYCFMRGGQAVSICMHSHRGRWSLT